MSRAYKTRQVIDLGILRLSKGSNSCRAMLAFISLLVISFFMVIYSAFMTSFFASMGSFPSMDRDEVLVVETEFHRNIGNLLLEHSRGRLGKYACPCCGWHGDHLAPAGPSPNRLCSKCGSFERHRRACALLGAGGLRGASNESIPFLKRPPTRDIPGMPFRLVHFGPHAQMERVLNSAAGIDQVGLDYFSDGYSYSPHVLHADASNIPLPTNFADGVVIFHVLEHVSELERAMDELKRVVFKTSGWILIEVPCKTNAAKKPHIDCRGNMTKEQRTQKCGQEDHVWLLDCATFRSSLAQRGLDCYALDGKHPADYGRAAPIMESCGCTKTAPLYVCTGEKG